MADGDWERSTEGDLDPDLTDEAEYGAWEPPARRGWRFAYRLMLLAALLSVVGGTLLVVRW